MRPPSRRGAAGRLGLALIAAGFAGTAGTAQAASATVGVRYGMANATGELFHGSPDLTGELVGVQLGLRWVPALQVEIAGEYTSHAFSFEHGLFEGVAAAGAGEYEDVTLLATARVRVLAWMLVPLEVYAGGGASVHYVDLALHDVAPVSSAGSDLEDAIRAVAGEATKIGWHLVAGARITALGSPFALFLEGRYQDPFRADTGVPTTASVYLGVDINL
jgi:hypothetical protein